jgi:CheY-like chemotaxis protein
MNKINCILLVDDDETTNFVNQLMLEDLEVTDRILVAYNGREALTLIQQECCPMLILLDINMPVMNGFEFMEAYERLESVYKQSVVVVMLTTSLNPKDVNRLQEMPIQGFFNKPLTEEMVWTMLRQYLNGASPNPDLPA